jgi:hypothetical protein
MQRLPADQVFVRNTPQGFPRLTPVTEHGFRFVRRVWQKS